MCIAPTSVALGSSGNELLWIIDIYSLVILRMVLPMGALGDKIGFKRPSACSAAPFWHRLAVRRAVADYHDADCLTRFAGGGARR